MPTRLRSWVVSLVLGMLLLAAAVTLKPSTSAASTGIEPAALANNTNPEDIQPLTSLLYDSAIDVVLDDPLSLSLDGDSLIDLESVVKVGEDDALRGDRPRSIQTLTDPSLFARRPDYEQYLPDILPRLHTAVAALPPQTTEVELSAFFSGSDIGGFDSGGSAPTITVANATAVPEPSTMSLMGLALLAAAVSRSRY
ncbi:PEP-CTERM sorting domain-containing protein [Planctomycetales bacterium ZRK34]|nr:PEP-CTERM sorting domain-containing protein [Planctomycetales bacterium ZRK34]